MLAGRKKTPPIKVFFPKKLEISYKYKSIQKYSFKTAQTCTSFFERSKENDTLPVTYEFL